MTSIARTVPWGCVHQIRLQRGSANLASFSSCNMMATMSRTKMHEDEIETSVGLVSRLVSTQFPQWAGLPLTLFPSDGTDHDVYRLGDHLSVRMPLIESATSQALKEAEWLLRLAPHLPLAIPTQVAMGQPGEGYPFLWSVCTWLPGESAANATIGDLELAARDLSAFIIALRKVATTGAHPRPPRSRGAPLSELDEAVRRSVAALGDRIDGGTTMELWEDSLRADPWDGPEVWPR